MAIDLETLCFEEEIDIVLLQAKSIVRDKNERLGFVS